MRALLNKLIEEISRLWNWLWGKKDEVTQMDYRDAYMAHLVLDILQTSQRNEFVMVPLNKIFPIHPTDNRENTIQATNKRAEIIEEYKPELLKMKRLSKERLAELMPSATYMRAISKNAHEYYSFEGNGRIAALKQVFSDHDGIEIEMDIYHPKNIKRSRKKIRKLRKLHGM